MEGQPSRDTRAAAGPRDVRASAMPQRCGGWLSARKVGTTRRPLSQRGGGVALCALIIVASDSQASISDAVPPPISLLVQAYRVADGGAKTNVLIYVAADFLMTLTRVVLCRNGR